MRFTILTQYYPPEVGAAQVRLAAFAKTLIELGHDVVVVTAMPNYPTGKVFEGYKGKIWFKENLNGVDTFRTWIYPATGRRVIPRLISYLSFMFSCLLALFFVPKADILFVESPPLFLCISGWLGSILRRQRLCLNISDLWPDSVIALGVMSEGLFIRGARRLESWLYKEAWCVCGVTHGVMEGIRAKGVPNEKTKFLPNGVDTTLFRPNLQVYQDYKPYTFLYAGTHGYAHGMDVLIYAAAQLQERRDICLHLVGDGADKLRIVQLVKQLNLENVRFDDPISVEEVAYLFQRTFAALVTVAKGDFFAGTRSAKILPAMASGKAILHSGFGEGGKLVEQAAAGIVVPPSDPEKLAQAIVALVDHPMLAEQMGKNGRRFVEKHYSWVAIVSTWLASL